MRMDVAEHVDQVVDRLLGPGEILAREADIVGGPGSVAVKARAASAFMPWAN